MRVDGYTIAFDRDSHKHRSCLYVPINKVSCSVCKYVYVRTVADDQDLTIHLVVHAKGPCTSDLAFEIYLSE